MLRHDGRQLDQIRRVEIIPRYTKYAEGSVMIRVGNTWVICTATVEEKVAPHKKLSGEGWITAEYSMLPRATRERCQRDISRLRLAPRSAEIQRLIGRSLRGAVDLRLLGPRTITIDCDVVQADGGTRTASVTGGYVALTMALKHLLEQGVIEKLPLKRQVAAISAGIVGGRAMVDLSYREDVSADVDINVVMDDRGDFIELQGTGENTVFTRDDVNSILDLSAAAIGELMTIQRKYTGDIKFI